MCSEKAKLQTENNEKISALEVEPPAVDFKPEDMHIVVVDDEESITRIMQAIMTRQGYRVTAFNDPIKASEEIPKISPDLLLFDVMMPNMNGFTLYEGLKSHPDLKDVPAIFISANESDRDRLYGLALGAVDYISKPYNNAEVKQKVNNYLTLRYRGRMLERFNEELQKKVEEKTRDLSQAQAKLFLSEKLASLGQLAAGIAHEINNPMGFVYSNLQTLMKYANSFRMIVDFYQDLVFRHNLQDECKDMEDELKINRILDDLSELMMETLEGADRIKDIVKNMKTFAHPGGSETRLENMGELLDNTLKVAHNELKYHVKLIKDYQLDKLVMCNAQELKQVFLNIIINSSQALKEKGKGNMTIRTFERDDMAVIEIRDDGPGISDENMNKIFDPFFTTKEIGKGSGLGLPLCFNIVNNHGGEIEVESDVGIGTVFRIILPYGGNDG